ncbi:hypothetical protein [Undibacterium parvum]|uniref:Porin n=1 Tax=Undibacterium parvum TaxID=401471 RepID=A0A3S9HGT7_9BURK|nr:hypothetical protein [Undibacterium parvum]AZP11278.1 hypothetical protein EJN92_04200 [Undibacterium parvum]
MFSSSLSALASPATAARTLAKFSLLAISLVLLSSPAQALDLLDGKLEFNAYGTLGLAKTNQSKPGYRSKANYNFSLDDSYSGIMDNRLGLQLSAQITPAWSLVAHTLTHRNSDDLVETELAWAQAKWKINEQSSIYLGRSQNILFLTSEEFYVGYSQPWVRPPVELYSMGGENSGSDGIVIQHRLPLSGRTLSLEARVGVSSLNRANYTVRNQPNIALAASLVDNELLLRASLLQADVTVRGRQLDSIIKLISDQNPMVGAEYSLENIHAVLYGSLGMRYEHNNWLLMTEIARTQLKRKSLPDQRAAYITLGRNFGNWMPYLSYAKLQVLGETTETRLTGGAALAANAFLATKNNEQQTLSLGLRWDIKPGLALKGQWDRVTPNAGEPGLLTGKLPAGQNHLNVMSVVLDWAY